MTSRRTAKSRAVGIAALATSAVLVAACGSSSSSSTTTSSAAASTTPAAASTTSSSSTTAAAAGVMVGAAKGSGGTYLTGPDGRALYLWVADTGSKSSCSGACAQVWPPLITKGKPTAGPGVNAADLGTTTRSGGTEEVTYKGHPLYYFIADKSSGQIKGQGSNSFGAKWWLVAPSGSAITSGGSSGGSSSSGSSNSSSTSKSGWG